MVGGEDLVVVVPGRRHLSGGDDERPVDEAEVELGPEPLLARDRVGADVCAREDGGRSHLASGTDGLGDDITCADVERATERAERRVEICKRFEEERPAVRGAAVAGAPDPFVEHE